MLQTTCRRCGRLGFVRKEVIVRGADTIVAFYCGSCDYNWETPHERVAETGPDAAKRKRPHSDTT